jgi:hypothetical protein
MTTNKKMTKADYYKQILANYPLTKDEQDFVNHELELLAKKNSSEKKPTAVQVANDGIKTAILEGMEVGRLYTITELIKEIPELAELTNQRVSALVRQLKEDEKIVRVEDKRKAFFRLA